MEISVRDTGPGISESDKQKLFQSFSQMDNGCSEPMGGSGLGLAISKRLVDIMSGTIGVDTVLGQGSRFWFRLTLETSASCASRTRSLSEKQAVPVTFNRSGSWSSTTMRL